VDVDRFRAQLEGEMEWREAEIRFFQNTCEQLDNLDLEKQFRRALILMLYSHFEGYCKFALSLYVSVINNSGALCKDANPAIVASSMNDVLQKLREGTGKAPEFKNSLPDDSKLHRFARDREFVQRIDEVLARRVKIPEDTVDMESNLKPVILRKNLYRLGLQHDQFADLEGQINKLLELRNTVAHGASRAGVERATYEDLRASASRVMTAITASVTRAVEQRLYLAGRA
jgi:hypothetical protein